MAAKDAIRTCLACRRKAAKPTLVRIVRTPGGLVEVDAGGRADGRGAYLCRDVGCLAAARRGKRLAQALRAEVDERAWAMIEQAFAEMEPGWAQDPADKEQC